MFEDLKRLFGKNLSPPYVGHLRASCEFRYKLDIIDKDGNVRHSRPWVSNMIPDCGINNLFNGTELCNAFLYLEVGNGVSPTPVRRDTGSTTLTQVATTVTASGNFFTSADVGRLIKYNDGPGTEVYITGYTSGTVVTVGTSASIGPINATIWYVNRTTLDSWVSNMGGNTYSGTGGDNGSTVSGNTITMFRKIIGGACTSPTTLTEIAFNNANNVTNCFDLDIITGGVAVIVGDQAVATCQLTVSYSGTTPSAVGNVATGYDSSGSVQIESFGFSGLPSATNAAIDLVKADGSSSSDASRFAEPGNTTPFGIALATFTQATFSNTTFPATVTNVNIAGTQGFGALVAYSNGSFRRDTYYQFNLGSFAGTIYGLLFMQSNGNNQRWGSLKFTTPFTKSNSQTLDFTVRKSLLRVLVN
jgi:hypothetical protein